MSKNFLVIGASSGIGEAIAKQLRSEGHAVFTASRTSSEIQPSNYLQWDATTPDISVFSALPEVIHGVVYCPGTINLKPINRLSLEDFKNDFQINVVGAVAVIQAVLPRLKKAEGASIVLFSTVASKIGMSFHTSIAASKGAVEGFSKSLAAELATYQIRVNCVAPALTDTPFAKNLLSSDEKREASNKRHPLGRVGKVEDMAQISTFLLSDASSWITGQIIGVDGGLSSIR